MKIKLQDLRTVAQTFLAVRSLVRRMEFVGDELRNLIRRCPNTLKRGLRSFCVSLEINIIVGSGTRADLMEIDIVRVPGRVAHADEGGDWSS